MPHHYVTAGFEVHGACCENKAQELVDAAMENFELSNGMSFAGPYEADERHFLGDPKLPRCKCPEPATLIARGSLPASAASSA